MIHRKTIHLLTAFLFWATAVFAQNPHPHFRNYTTDHGLPDLTVYQAMQDSRGFLWFATENGVCRFDGYEFQRFPGPPEVNYFPVFDLQEDEKGRIWFNSFHGNLFYVENDSIHSYWNNHIIRSYNDRFSKGANFYIRNSGETVFIELDYLGILEIKADGENRLRQAPFPIGLLMLEVAPGKFVFQSTEKGSQSKINSWKKELKQNKYSAPITFSTQDTVLVFEHLPNPFPKNSSRKALIKIDSSAYLLFYRHQLFYIKNNQLEWKKYYEDEVFDIIKSRDGSIYFCISHAKGIRRYKDMEAVRRKEYSTLLNGQTVTWMCEDKDGGMWLSTYGQGIYYTPDPDFLIYDQSSGLSDEIVRSISIESENNLFVGLQNGDVYRLSTAEDDLEQLVERRSNEFLYHIYFDSLRQNLWIGTNRGLFALNPKNKEVYFPPPIRSAYNLLYRHFTPSPDLQRLWGFQRIGLASLDLSSKTYTLITPELGYQKRISGILEDYEGQVWFGTRDGLKQWQNSMAIDLPHLPLVLQGYISCLAQLPDSTLVVGTRGYGLVFLKNDSTQVLRIADGLTFNAIEKLHIEGDSTIWAITRHGLNRIIRHSDGTFQIEHFTVADGLPSNVVWDVKTTRLHIWVATNKGLVQIPRKSLNTSSAHPVLSTLEVNGEKVEASEVSDFPHNKNSFAFHFSTLKYNQFGRIEYRYRLLSSSINWNVTQSRRADFPALVPNQYTFEVQSKNENGVWSETTAYSFEIRPPWWQRGWFYFLVIMIVMTAIFYFDKYRTGIIKKEFDLQKQLSDMEKKALQAQMNPHFIFNCLNSIRRLIMEENNENAVTYLTHFSRLVRSALKASPAGHISLEEEINMLKNYLELEKLRFKDAFDYAIEVDDSIDLFEVVLPPMLIQPYVENAVIHGMEAKESDGRIGISFHMEGSYLLVTITDNGPGIRRTRQKHTLHKSVGMSLTRRRLELLNIQSSGDLVKITDVQRDNGEVQGTKVEVRINQSW